MKKIVAGLLIIFILIPDLRAQDKPLIKGMNSVNVYYGVSVLGSFYKRLFAIGGADGLDFQVLGPLGITYEHMLTDVVGLGAELGYHQFKATWNYIGSGTQGQNLVQSEIRYSVSRFMLRTNFHFGSGSSFDAYGFVSAGYRHAQLTMLENGVVTPYTQLIGVNFIPFGVKPGLGLRYFFLDNMGLHLEIAGGTPMIGGGLSARF
jgi:hypothetical protein